MPLAQAKLGTVIVANWGVWFLLALGWGRADPGLDLGATAQFVS